MDELAGLRPDGFGGYVRDDLTFWDVQLAPSPTHRFYFADQLSMEVHGKPPGRFHRFMLKLVFGIRVELL